jgi:hypothetical protein
MPTPIGIRRTAAATSALVTSAHTAFTELFRTVTFSAHKVPTRSTPAGPKPEGAKPVSDATVKGTSACSDKTLSSTTTVVTLDTPIRSAEQLPALVAASATTLRL